MGDTAPTPLPWLVADILGTGRLHDNFVGALLDCLRVTDANGETLSTEQQKSGVVTVSPMAPGGGSGLQRRKVE